MITSKILTLFAGLLSTGSAVFYPKPAETAPHAALQPAKTRSDWAATEFLGASLGAGVLVSSRSYPLLTHGGSRVNQLFFQNGQQVRKGDPLVQLSSNSHVIAPANGIVTQLAVKKGDYLPAGTPVAHFTELVPLRLRLRRDAVKAAVQPGQYLQLQSPAQPSRGLTATVLGSTVEGNFLLLDLRLRTTSDEPLPAGAPVNVHALRL
ncbi:MAG TPA: biotin/lipoyl-containing protein [Hymenobacter sp.]|jgi:biotin carboxyl carrier protein